MNDDTRIVMVQLMKPTITVSSFGMEKPLECSDIADGCVGISLWFDSEENAKKWGGEDADLQYATVTERDSNPSNTEAKD